MRLDRYSWKCVCGNCGTIQVEKKMKKPVVCAECGKSVPLVREGHVSGVLKLDTEFFGTPIDRQIWATTR